MTTTAPRRALFLALALAALTALAPAPAGAQDTLDVARDTLPPGQRDSLAAALADSLARTQRPLDELVRELPGRPTGLERLEGVALERSLPLESSRVRRNLAAAGVAVEGGAFDPALVLGADVAKSRQLPERSGSYEASLQKVLPWGTSLGLALTGSRSPTPSDVPDSYAADVGLSVTQPLLDGLGTRDTELRVARLERRASVQRLSRSTQRTVADVRLAYWNLAEAEAIQGVLQRSYEIAEALLARNRQLAERELVAEVDVLTARSGVALRRASLVDARRSRRDAAESLVFLVWGEEAPGELVRDTLPLKTAGVELPSVDELGMEGAVASALAQRRDLEAARSELEGAEVAAESAERATLPSLSLDGSLRTGGTETSLGSSIDALDGGVSWSVGLRFSQPLGNRTDEGRSRMAELTRELRRLELILVENGVRQDAREAVRAIRAGRERLEAAERAAELASRQLAAERRRLELGLGDSFRLLETEENAVQAQLESVRARYDLARAVTRFRLSQGEVLEP